MSKFLSYLQSIRFSDVIKILKIGKTPAQTKFRKTCCWCQCEFTYETEDIVYLGSYHEYHVNCPTCYQLSSHEESYKMVNNKRGCSSEAEQKAVNFKVRISTFLNPAKISFMIKVAILAFVMFLVLSCNNLATNSFESEKLQYEKNQIKEIIYLKDSTVNLCFAVWEDHFSDKQMTCVPCDSVKNKLK